MNKKKASPLYVSDLPLHCDAQILQNVIEERGIDQIGGVKHIRKSRGRGYSTNVKLPRLKEEDVLVEIDPAVATKFNSIEHQPQDISMELSGGGCLAACLTPAKDNRWNVVVSWMDNNQKDMAFDSAFPLINACHRIIYSKDGVYHVDFKIEMNDCDLILPMKFITALLTYRKRKDSFIRKFDGREK
ncbi:MAG: hypothetical protein NC453_12240 [Muribaculum sp.]|nr:hypothetical protein [Muribaculum sp.]